MSTENVNQQDSGLGRIIRGLTWIGTIFLVLTAVAVVWAVFRTRGIEDFITAQLMGFRFHKAAGLDIVYVPFKGTPETVNGLLTGSVQAIYAANVTVNPLIESGKVKALAKLDRRTPSSVANVPALADAADLPNLEDMSVWLGLVAPKGTPRPIVDKIQRKVVEIMNDPAMVEKSTRTGAFAFTSTPEEFSSFMREEASRWQKVLQETNIKFD